MIPAIFNLLILICVFALVVYVVLWVLRSVGVPLPEQAIKILWVIVGLIAIYYLFLIVTGGGAGVPKLL